MIIDDLLAVFGENSIHKLGLVITVSSQVLRTFEQEFALDKNARDAAIDTVIDLLQTAKQLVVPPPVVPPVTPPAEVPAV